MIGAACGLAVYSTGGLVFSSYGAKIACATPWTKVLGFIEVYLPNRRKCRTWLPTARSTLDVLAMSANMLAIAIASMK